MGPFLNVKFNVFIQRLQTFTFVIFVTFDAFCVFLNFTFNDFYIYDFQCS